MKLVALAVVLSCCLVHAYCGECSADKITTIQQQWTSTFGSNNRHRLFEFGLACFLRMMGQNIPVSGGATGTSRLMARLGSAILLLNNPTVLQQRISAYHRQNSTNADSPADTMQTYLNVILQTLPEFVGQSYDEDAWRDCVTMLVRRITQS